MKILYLAFIDLSVENADTIHPLEICENLTKLGHEILMFTPSCKTRTLPNIRIVRTGMFKIPLLKGFLHHLLLLPLLFFFCFRKKADLIYSRYHPMEILATYPIKKLFNIKYILEVNGAMKEEIKIRGEPEWKMGIYSALEGRLFKLADKIITVTENLRDYLVKEYNLPAPKIEVIPNGTNVEMFHPMDKERCRERVDISLQSIVLCFVGSLRPWHGVENTIEMLPELIKHISNVKLLIVGDGPLMKNLKKRVTALSLDERVVFTGKIKREKVPFYINSADVCLAPFNLERNRITGLSPMKIFDYMACAKPIITTDVGGLGELIEKYNVGLVVPPEDLKRLTEVTILLINNKELQKKLGKNGRTTAVREFSWAKIAKEVEKICIS